MLKGAVRVHKEWAEHTTQKCGDKQFVCHMTKLEDTTFMTVLVTNQVFVDPSDIDILFCSLGRHKSNQQALPKTVKTTHT